MNNDINLIETTLNSEDVFKGVLLNVKKDTVKLPNQKTATREWVLHPGAAAVLPILPNGDVILVKQYRYPLGRVTLEIPAGKLNNSEDPIDCVKRELAEETGYKASSFHKLGVIATTVGFSNEHIHLYLADNIIAGEKMCTDEDEFIDIIAIKWTELMEKIINNIIIDAKTIIAVLLARKYIISRS